MPDIEDMPDEVVVNIFSYLPLIDRKNTRLVSKRWHQLSYSISLIKNDITAVNNYLLLDKTISPNTRHINVRTKIVDDKKNSSSNLRSLQFWSRCGQDIKSVEIFQVDVYSEILLDVFENCPNLQYLSLSYWDENDIKRPNIDVIPGVDHIPYGPVNFPKLLSLDLMHMSHLNAEALRRLTQNAPLLKRISLEWWRPLREDRAILEVFREIVTRHANQLKEINVSHSYIIDEYVQEVAKVMGPQLSGFYIQWCELLTDRCVPYIAKHMMNLKELDVGQCSFSDEGFIALFSGMTKLTHVCLKKCKQINDAAIAALKSLPNLTGLDLTDCPNISDEGIKQVFGDEIRVKMMDLRLSKLKKITDDAIINIAPNLPNLRFLYLNGCVKLSDKSLEVIFTHNRLLRCFSLQDCARLRDLNVGPSVNALKGLIHLDLFGCRKIAGKSIRCLRLIELQTADLSDVNLSIDDVSSVLSGCPSLQYLYLDYHLQNVQEKLQRENSMAKPIFRCGFSRFEPDSLFD